MNGYEIYGIVIVIAIACGVLCVMWQVGKSAWRDIREMEGSRR